MNVALPDGRKVELQDYGDPDGAPALWFHGAFSSRLEAGYLDAPARELGLRILSLDRPGVGGSDPLPGRTVTGYAADAAGVLDAFGIEQAAVGGLSNGGMFAMAVGFEIPERVARVVPVNPTTPMDRAARAALSRTGRLSYAYMQRRRASVVKRLMSGATPGRLSAAIAHRSNPDAHLFDDPDTAAAWAANTAEVLRQPNSGYLDSELDMGTVRPWGFDHRAVRVPVILVSGEKDAGLAYAKVWAQELPEGRLVVVPGGHGGMVAPPVARRVVELLAGRP